MSSSHRILQRRASMGAVKSTLVRRLLVEDDGQQVDAMLWRCEGGLYVRRWDGRYFRSPFPSSALLVPFWIRFGF